MVTGPRPARAAHARCRWQTSSRLAMLLGHCTRRRRVRSRQQGCAATEDDSRRRRAGPGERGAAGDSLERRSEARGRVELESRNLGVEGRIVVANEMIVTFHVSAWRLE